MSVNLEPDQQDGQMRFRLGPVERWVVAGVAAVFIAMLTWFGRTVVETKDALQVVVTQQAVMTLQMTTLTAQLADVPTLRTQVAELKVKVDRHNEDIKELRATKGLR